MQRNSQIGKNLPDPRQQSRLVESDKLKESFSVGVGRPERTLGLDGTVAEFCRLATGLRWLPATLCQYLLQTKPNNLMTICG